MLFDGHHDEYQATAEMPYGISYRCRKCGALNTEKLNFKYRTKRVRGHGHDSDMRIEMYGMGYDGLVDSFAGLNARVNNDAFVATDIPYMGKGVCVQCGCCQPWGTTSSDDKLPKSYTVVFTILIVLAVLSFILFAAVFKVDRQITIFFPLMILFAMGSAAVAYLKKKNLNELRNNSMNAVQNMKDNHEEAYFPRISNTVDESSNDERILALNDFELSPTDINVDVRSYDDVHNTYRS